MWSLAHDRHTILGDNSIYLNRTASCSVIRQIGLSNFKYGGKNLPVRIGHMIGHMHMRSVCKRILGGILWEISELMLHKKTFNGLNRIDSAVELLCQNARM